MENPPRPRHPPFSNANMCRAPQHGLHWLSSVHVCDRVRAWSLVDDPQTEAEFFLFLLTTQEYERSPLTEDYQLHLQIIKDAGP